MIFTYIEEKAEKLLSDADALTLPIDVLKCAKFLKIDVKAVTFDEEISGIFVMKDKMAHIAYNKNEPENRIRFTVAHELGHYVLHSQNTPLFIDKAEKLMFRNADSSSGEYRKEREANSFAAALLMPKQILLREIENLKKSQEEETIPYLSKKFKVSEQAMTIRLTNLGLIDFGLFS